MSKRKQALPPISTSEARMLTVQSAADYLSSTAWFVRTLAWEKKVPYVRLGKRLLFDRRDLDKFIESQKVSIAA